MPSLDAIKDAKYSWVIDEMIISRKLRARVWYKQLMFYLTRAEKEGKSKLFLNSKYILGNLPFVFSK